MSYCRATQKEFLATDGIVATNQYGEKHLYSPFAKFTYCIGCGERLVIEPNDESKITKIHLDKKKNLLCDKCHSTNHYFICDDCGKWSFHTDFTGSHLINENNPDKARLVCDECFENYAECDICGYHHKKDELKDIVG